MTRAVSREWSDAIAEWQRYARAQASRKGTLDSRRQQLEHLARRVDVGPWEVSAGQLLDYVSDQTWSQETRRNRRTAFRVFYGWAVEVGHVERSPALVLPRVRAAEPNPMPATDSVVAFTLAGATERERLMVRLAAEHGLRRAEVAVVHTRDLVEDLDGWTLVVHGKGGRERMVPLVAEVAAQLRGLEAGYAFPGRDGGHLSPRWVGKLVGRLMPGSWTMHKLRHRAATNWHEVDGDLLVVMELLGHASPATTRRYVKIRSSKLRATVEAAA